MTAQEVKQKARRCPWRLAPYIFTMTCLMGIRMAAWGQADPPFEEHRCTYANPCDYPEQTKMADEFVDSIGLDVQLDQVNSPYYTLFQQAVVPAFEHSGIRHARFGTYPKPSQANQNIKPLIDAFQSSTGERLGFNLQEFGLNCSNLLASLVTRGNLSWIPLENIDSFEGLNEWNGISCSGATPWNQQDAEFQRALYAAVKSDPLFKNIPVVGPSLAYFDYPTRLVKDAAAIGRLTDAMTYANAHIYNDYHAPSTAIPVILGGTLPMNGRKPVIATEAGYHTDTLSGGVSEAAQGNYFSRLFFEFLNAGIRRTYAYELMDNPLYATTQDSMGGPEANYGLIHADGSYKVAFTTISNEIAILRDPGPAFDPQDLTVTLWTTNPQIHHTVLQKRNGTFYLVLWQEVDGYAPGTGDISVPAQWVQIDFAQTFTTINQYDPRQAPTPYWNYANTSQVVVPIGDSALILELIP